MTISYDKIFEHNGMLLDLPFLEGIGTETRDQARSHHNNVTLINTPTWTPITSGLGVLVFDNTAQDYLELAAADCLDLNFEGANYSLGVWFNWTDTGTSLNIMGRYELDVSGWELYLFAGGGGQNYLTLRHHHAGTLVPPVTGNPRSGCYSSGWTPGTWWFLGITRPGSAEGQFYKNGVPETMVTGGLVDPESCAQDLVIGARYTKNADYFKGSLWRPRLWQRALTQAEWLNIFNLERDWFGV